MGRVHNINPRILKECRRQLCFSIEEVQKKISKIKKMEEGDLKPTFKQLETIAELYNVPRWVFIRNELPEEFRYETIVPGFRQIKENSSFTPETSATVSTLMARVSSLRELILDLSDDIEQEILNFNPPSISDGQNPEEIAQHIRDWLGVNGPLPLAGWREKLEEKGLFIFMTSKYPGWSKVDRKLFRGVSIYHEKLPIIIINDSDFRKAQNFTLFHELGHLLRRESNVDNWKSHTQIETWCDRLAGAILMPQDQMVIPVQDSGDLKKAAKKLQVSPYAYLVRQKQLKLISQDLYNNLEAAIKKEWEAQQEELKKKPRRIPRKRSQEIIHQYGHLYTRTLFQAYHEKTISLHRLMSLLEFKKAKYVFEAREFL